MQPVAYHRSCLELMQKNQIYYKPSSTVDHSNVIQMNAMQVTVSAALGFLYFAVISTPSLTAIAHDRLDVHINKRSCNSGV